MGITKEYLWGTETWYNITPEIMVKIIKTHDRLSLQVHPDDGYALEHEGEKGKPEWWYILECAEDAEIIYGLKPGITRNTFENLLNNGNILEAVNTVRVHPGDMFNVPPGTVHAIGANITLLEVQPNSNLTYRVYDYGRLDSDGNPRPLHIQKALDVIFNEEKP
jgi:mannose-6-phosphate isomerase